jgi:hypothetical protein
MHRRFSSLVKGSSSKEPGSLYTADNESKVSTIVREEPLPVPSLKVKRVDHYYSRWTKSWKYRVQPLPSVYNFYCSLFFRTQVPRSLWRPSPSCRAVPTTCGRTLVSCKLNSRTCLNYELKIIVIRIVRKIPKQENFEPTFKLVVKSEYILKACKDVIQSWPGISWNSDPLEVTHFL